MLWRGVQWVWCGVVGWGGVGLGWGGVGLGWCSEGSDNWIGASYDHWIRRKWVRSSQVGDMGWDRTRWDGTWAHLGSTLVVLNLIAGNIPKVFEHSVSLM